MSEIIFKYINDNLQLPNKIKNIEKDFKNGFLFSELLKKSGNLKSLLTKYNNNPKNISEIKDNFHLLKKELQSMGIYLNESTINDIISEKEGVATQLIYKIKTEIDRDKINFVDIIGKINENSYREKYELRKNNNNLNFNRTNRLELTQTNKFSMSPTTTRETLSTFTNFFVKPNNKNRKNLLLSQDFKTEIKDSKQKTKILLKPILSNSNIRESDNKNKFMTTTLGYGSFKDIEKYKNDYDYILEKVNDESEKNVGDKDFVLNKPNVNKKIRKNKSTNIYRKRSKLKIDALNSENNKILNNNNNKLIQYSLLDKNTKKLGININEIAPKLSKNGINYNNDTYLNPTQIISSLKKVISSKKLEKKFILGKISLTDKNNQLKSNENFLKYSIINHNNDDNNKLSKINFNKNSTKYKMLEFNKLIDIQNDYIDRMIKKSKQIKGILNTDEEKTKQNNFDIEEYINIVDNDNNIKNPYEESIKNQIHLNNLNNIRPITNLIIDFVEECYKSQKKLKKELIDLPEFREWSQFFIEGKSCLKLPIRTKKDKNTIPNNENNINNLSTLTRASKRIDNKKEKKININNNEFIYMEYIDYIFYRGNWEINNFIDSSLYGNDLHIYQVLGDDIFNIIPNVVNLFQGAKGSALLKKSNNDFELTANELINVQIPKSNIRNALLGEIILLNYDNISNEINNNNINNNLNNVIKKLNSVSNTITNNESSNKLPEPKKEEIIPDKINDIDFSYIPIKICLIGHSYSGRTTQAKLLCEKYKNLKSYSVRQISQFYLDEYKKMHETNEKNTKKNQKKNHKNSKKDKEHKEEELKAYEEIFKLIEKYMNVNESKDEDLSNLIENEMPDELKINLLIYEIKKDFPPKNENEINEKIQERNQRKQKLEEELKELKEEVNHEQTNDKNKKAKGKSKKQAHNIDNITEELEKIVNESYEGFIIYDYPNNYNQYKILEYMTTGFIPEIDKVPDKRDIYMNILTNSIDKPYINISNTSKEGAIYLNNNNCSKKSFFNCYILLELSEEETLKRMKNRLKDPNTGIIYHKEYSPPNPTDKKLNDRLIALTEPNDEKIKDLLAQFYSEYPKILYYIYLFNNFYRIDSEDKDEIFKTIEDIISGEIKKFEERENKDIMGNLINNLDYMDENEVVKYFKRLNESKKVIPKELSEEIIKNWFDYQDKYIKGVRNFIKNLLELKYNIIQQLNNYQEEFIDFLNTSSNKYKIVDIFYEKYNTLIEKYPHIKNNHLVKEEFETNLNELIDHIWEIIQNRKIDFISELDSIKKQQFIEQQLELFGEYVINLFILETNQYYNKVNLIKKFYFEFENQKVSEKFPYEYTFKKDIIIDNINQYPIFEIKSFSSKKYKISPKLDKLYLNCYKLFFKYDNAMSSIYEKEKESNNLNSSGVSSSSPPKRKIKTYYKAKTKTDMKSELSAFSENKAINYEDEMKAALSNEKIKYKIRILFLKNFAEKNLKEIYLLGQNIFKNLDQQIISSVNWQNNAMNKLISKIKKNIKEGVNKLYIKDIELDLFDIYEKKNPKFSQVNIKYLYSIPDLDKMIDYSELYKVFLDIKTFEIQNNYTNLYTLIDIVFKKHLFEHKSEGFMKYMHRIPFYNLNNFINRFTIKTDKGYSVVKLNEIFTTLALLNTIPPSTEQQNNMLKEVNDKLKYKIYLSKHDFMNNKLWFEKVDDKIGADGPENLRQNNFMHHNTRSLTLKKLHQGNSNTNSPAKDRRFRARGSAIFVPSGILNTENKKTLKEFLFDVNKNEDEFIDFIDFMKRITIKKIITKRKKSMYFQNSNEIRNALDKVEIQNSLLDSQISESTNYFKGSKTLISSKVFNNPNNNINANSNEEPKIISHKSQKFNESIKDIKDISDNNNVENTIHFPEYTYFDYLIKKNNY